MVPVARDPARPFVADPAPAQAVALVFVAISSLQVGAAIGATLFDDVGAAGAALLRLAWAGTIMLLVVRPRARGRTARERRLVGLFALVLGAMNLCIYEAIDRIPLGVAVTIEFAGPLGVAVALSRRRADLAWAAVAAAGVVLLADPGGGGTDAVGVALALVAAASWGAYILIAQRAGRVFAGRDGLALAMAASVLVPLAPGLAAGGADLLHPATLAIAAAVAVMSSVVPYSLETEALRVLPAHVFGVLMSLEPAVAALAGLAVLGQSLSARDVVAIALVVVASVGVTRRAAAAPRD
jgi:inner membrane transporter RhtA